MKKTMGLGGMTHFRTHKIFSYAILDFRNPPPKGKKASKFFSWRWEHSETKLTEEYCWANKQAAGRLRSGLSVPSVLEFLFHTQLTICTFLIHSFLNCASFFDSNYCGECLCEVIYRLVG